MRVGLRRKSSEAFVRTHLLGMKHTIRLARAYRFSFPQRVSPVHRFVRHPPHEVKIHSSIGVRQITIVTKLRLAIRRDGGTVSRNSAHKNGQPVLEIVPCGCFHQIQVLPSFSNPPAEDQKVSLSAPHDTFRIGLATRPSIGWFGAWSSPASPQRPFPRSESNYEIINRR